MEVGGVRTPWVQPWPLVRDRYARLLREMLRLEALAKAAGFKLRTKEPPDRRG